MDDVARKKPQPDFLIRLIGSNVKPWSVPMRSLGRVLAAVQRLVDQRDDLADADEEEKSVDVSEDETRTLRLLSVRADSAGYAVASKNKQVTLSILRETGRSIEEPNTANWHPSTVSSLDDLSQIAKQLGCHIELRSIDDSGSSGDVIAVIRPSTFAEVQQRAFVRGHTSVYGRLERVGGATACKCGIHVRGRPKMLFCEITNPDLVCELGKYIYSDVVLSGEVVWYRFDQQIKTMFVSSFSPAKTELISEVAKKIRDAGGCAWDNIADPEAFSREMRG
jgi:hypothetical protein